MKIKILKITKSNLKFFQFFLLSLLTIIMVIFGGCASKKVVQKGEDPFLAAEEVSWSPGSSAGNAEDDEDRVPASRGRPRRE